MPSSPCSGRSASTSSSRPSPRGSTSDPLDKTISYTIVFVILGALPLTVRTMYSRGEATVVE